MIRCPHCFVNVLPIRDGICPSCQGDTRKPSQSTLTPLWISVGEKLPPICINCGTSTRRKVTVVRTFDTGRQEQDSGHQLGPNLAVIAFELVKSVAKSVFAQPVEGIGLKIPQCGPCAKLNDVAPLHVDNDGDRMEFAADRRFCEEVESLREPHV